MRSINTYKYARIFEYRILLAAMLLSIGSCLEPVYLFPSGLPQPADLFFLLSLIVYLPACKFTSDIDSLTAAFLALFVLWVYTVTAAWIFILSDPLGILRFAYIAYNALLCFQIMILAAQSPRMLRLIAIGCAISLTTLGAGALAASGNPTARFTGTANNPNQLAFWGLTAFCLVMFVHTRIGLRAHWVWGALLGAIILAAVSVSKATAVAMGSFLLLYGLTKGTRAVVAAVGLLAALLVYELKVQSMWQLRLVSSGEKTHLTSMWTYRGYDRIFDNIQYLLFGASELQPERFAEAGRMKMEIHSTFGSVLFSYGSVGLLLFGAILISAARRDFLHSLIFLSPAMVYGLTHNGIRSTTFWLLVGAIAGCSTKLKSANQLPSRIQPANR
jgi:hypothetical protein